MVKQPLDELSRAWLNEPRRRGPTSRWWPLEPHAEQLQLVIAAFAKGVRFIGCDSARRSGKTDYAKRYLIVKIGETLHNHLPWPDPRFFYGMPTRDQVKRTAWRDLLRLIPNDWIAGGKTGRNVSQGELWVRFWWGAELWVLGMDNPARFEGPPWDGGVLDEMIDQPEDCFDLHVRPGLDTVENGVNRRGWCWMIGKPGRKGPGARWFRAFCEKCRRGEYPDGAAFTWPSRLILPADELKQARQTMSPADFSEQYEACWQNVGGGIYHAFSREFNCPPCSHRDNLPIIVGSDFNVDPMCWVLCHRIGEDLEVFDELVLHNANTPKALNELWKRWGHHRGGWQFYGDPSARARKTSATQSDYAHIHNDSRFQTARRTMNYASGPPAVEDRYSAVNARLCNAEETRRLFIDPRCTHLIEDMQMCAYKAGTREPAFDKEHFHCSDALGYVVASIWPIRFNIGGSLPAVIVGDTPTLPQSSGPISMAGVW
jgi:hypothetical protein